MKCIRCGEEMRNTIGGCYICDNCGFAVNDLVLRCETKNSKTAKETNVIDGKDLIGTGKITDATINGESFAKGEVWDKTTNVETDEGLRNKIKDLEQQLMEKDKEIEKVETYYKSREKNIVNDADEIIKKLEQQLAKKEKEIEKYISALEYNENNIPNQRRAIYHQVCEEIRTALLNEELKYKWTGKCEDIYEILDRIEGESDGTRNSKNV